MREEDKKTMRKQIMTDEFKEFYSKYPDKFIEEYLGVNLSLWQKLVLRLVLKEEK